MKIGIDIDQVLSDTMYTTLRYINKKYGYTYTINDITKYKFEEWIPNWTKEDSRRLFLRKNLYKYAPVIKDAVKSLEILFDSQFDTQLLTVRDKSLDFLTIDWLHDNNFPTNVDDVLFFSCGDKKIKYIKDNKFDIIVEDNLDYLRELNTSDGVFFLYLIDYPYNQNSPRGITRVSGWKEIIEDMRLWGFLGK